MVRVAIDGMGGDFAPLAVVRGAENACREHPVEVVLVGDKGAIEPLIREHDRITVVHAPGFVEMDESPSVALRKKRDSSMNRALALVKSGEAQAFVSAGNSGAAMAFAIYTLGRTDGVERPAIATVHPTVRGGASVLLDAGGNVDCKPIHLVQFAIMGDACARSLLGLESPRVGLLSNGEEETKGNELTRDAHALLREVGLNYMGYVEGTDMYTGNADVVVTDGFVGNVALKISEGVVEVFIDFFKQMIRDSLRMKIGYFFMKKGFDELARKTDYSEQGGAPLLGVNGISIICHGKSNEKAIKNAIFLAERFVEKDLNGAVRQRMEAYRSRQRAKEKG
jgi:phosphate acyltransferase